MNWPPIIGDPTIGTKTLHPIKSRIVAEDLSDLHEPAWWSGVRVSIATPSQVLDDAVFHVRLTKRDCTPAIDMAPCEWFQTAREWHMFPWLIPAAMGKELNLRLEVALVEDAEISAINENLYIGLTTCFHEMPYMPPRDSYLFVNDEGKILQMWNGRQRVDGVPSFGNHLPRGDLPVWRKNHRVIQPSWKWDANKLFCISDWDDIVPE